MIPKVIYQTYKSRQLPWITRFFIWWMRRVNPEYRYEFFDDARIDAFLSSEYSAEVSAAYRKLNIGAAKGDFFRYAVLYKYGGVYIDIDGAILKPLSTIIREDDEAIITREGTVHNLYAQWALIFNKEHPILQLALSKCTENINQNKFPFDVHKMTGPSVFTEAVNEFLAAKSEVRCRVLGVDYDRKNKSVLIPKHFLNRVIYFNAPRWTKEQQKKPVLKTG